MAWQHSLFQPRTFPLRPISLILLVVSSSIAFFSAAYWLRSPRAHISNQAEREAIQAALAEFSTKYSHGPGGARTIKATKLEGTGWIVQFTEPANPEPGGLRVINTFYVGRDSKCQWLSVEEWGAY